MLSVCFIGDSYLYLVTNLWQEKSESFGFCLRKKDFRELDKGEVARRPRQRASNQANYHGAQVGAEAGGSRAGGFHWAGWLFCGDVIADKIRHSALGI